MGIGKTFEEAFEKAEIAAGVIIPEAGSAFISVRDIDKQFLKEIAFVSLDLLLCSLFFL